jgi:hypothetical protein
VPSHKESRREVGCPQGAPDLLSALSREKQPPESGSDILHGSYRTHVRNLPLHRSVCIHTPCQDTALLPFCQAEPEKFLKKFWESPSFREQSFQNCPSAVDWAVEIAEFRGSVLLHEVTKRLNLLEFCAALPVTLPPMAVYYSGK